jgi:hypothetical protein
MLGHLPRRSCCLQEAPSNMPKSVAQVLPAGRQLQLLLAGTPDNPADGKPPAGLLLQLLLAGKLLLPAQ